MKSIDTAGQTNPSICLAVMMLGLIVLATQHQALAITMDFSECGRSSGTTSSIGTASYTAKTISSVPAYNWYHGCGPTAAASVFGYWDVSGFPNLFDAVENDIYLTANVQDHISSPAHNAKYDPTPDLLGPVPSFTSIADWFGTSVDPLQFGWSFLSLADDAFEGYASFREYEFEARNRLFSDQSSDSLFNWGDLVAEIDANRPLMFLVDTDGNGSTDHFVPVLGYDDRGALGRFYGLYTTWSEDETITWKPFLDRGNPWGVAYATFVRPISSPIPEPSTILLFGSGLIGLGAWRGKMRKSTRN